MRWSVFLNLLLGGLSSARVLAAATQLRKSGNSSCTPENTTVRKEWGSMTKVERKAYIDAVLCFQKKPSLMPKGLVPAAKTRPDDFTAIHINQTRGIHNNGAFLSWHRQFVWLYEKALQDECGYKGTQPYWDWTLWCNDLAGSPIFDGSETSMSGNGAPVKGRPNVVSPFGAPTLPGTGGGCVIDGPFKNMTTNFAIIDISFAFIGLPSTWSAYTPNCLTRDLNNALAKSMTGPEAVANLMASPDITTFQNRLSGGFSGAAQGPHDGGHFSVGGVMTNFFSSPMDPVFYLHHSNVDRVWTLWQAKNPDARQHALSGTSTIFNGRDTPEINLKTVQNWGILGPAKPTEELMNVLDSDFCYRYE